MLSFRNIIEIALSKKLVDLMTFQTLHVYNLEDDMFFWLNFGFDLKLAKNIKSIFKHIDSSLIVFLLINFQSLICCFPKCFYFRTLIFFW